MRPAPQQSAAAGALGAVPFQKDLALVAALVAVKVVALVFMAHGLVLGADVSAMHAARIELDYRATSISPFVHYAS